MRGNNFQELEVLALTEINQLCDELAELVDRLSGEEIVLCGSLAKLFAKNIPEDYLIKDVDFVVSRDVFKILQRQSCELHAVVSVEKTPERIILHTPHRICVEIWNTQPKNETETKKYYQNKIPYFIENGKETEI